MMEYVIGRIYIYNNIENWDPERDLGRQYEGITTTNN